MLFRPDRDDYRLVGLYTGKIVYGVGAAMLVPAAVALVAGEHNEAFGFVIGASLALIVGGLLQLTLRTRATMDGGHGLAIVGLAWIVVPVFGAVPLLLSGHYASYLDAYFEAVSGLVTSGLTLANDLDHMARSVNLWRHLMHFLGGQGIIIVVLSIFASAGGATGILYVGEGHRDRILPNVVHSARFILQVVAVYAAIGTATLGVALTIGGLPPLTALYHAVNLFMTSFHTAGFSVQSASAAFYRSPAVEAVLATLMIAGAFSFVLHYELWRRRRGELIRNLETRTIAASLLGLFAVMAVGLARTGTLTAFDGLLRIGFFQTISAHTTSGLATVPGRLFVTDWGVLAPATIVTAMALGGMAGSTAGGIKAIRVGLILKGLRRDVRRVLMPENAVVIEHYHATTPRVLSDDQVRGAATILLLFLVLYLTGGIFGLFYGYDLELAVFDSTAAAATSGLSVGLVRPGLEWPLKVAYIAQMIIGRLEFVAIFALAGYVAAIVRGRV